MSHLSEEDIATLPDFSRLEILVGREGAERLGRARVIVFGVGGVGSWCVESLVRSGIRHITIVDSDSVDPTNVNRQLPCTASTIGLAKVQAMRRRMLDINPHATVEAVECFFDESTAPRFDFDTYDYVVDAIDSLGSKALLIQRATAARRCRLFSSMGAASKLDPGRIHTAEFWKVTGCPLARALRQRFKKGDVRPMRPFRCVYSDEPKPASALPAAPGMPNGTMAHITAIFGFTLASMVINHILGRKD